VLLPLNNDDLIDDNFAYHLDHNLDVGGDVLVRDGMIGDNKNILMVKNCLNNIKNPPLYFNSVAG
jgi:hypothetical protein